MIFNFFLFLNSPFVAYSFGAAVLAVHLLFILDVASPQSGPGEIAQ